MTNIFKLIINNILNFNNYTWINIFTTVLFFYVIQTVFFIYIASKQYDTLLLEKATFLSQLSKYNNNVKEIVINMKNNADNNLKEKALESKKKRNILNNELIFNYCIKPILFVSTILLCIILYTLLSKTKRKWSYIETISIILVLGSYITELYFFFFIVKKYEIISDDEILYKLFKHLSDDVSRKINVNETIQRLQNLKIQQQNYSL